MSRNRKGAKGADRRGDTTSTDGGLLKKTIYLSAEDWQALRKWSHEKERSVSKIVRQFIGEALRRGDQDNPESTSTREEQRPRLDSAAPQSAEDLPEQISLALADLEQLDDEFMAVGKRIGAHEVLVADIVFFASLNRGLQILHGFTLLVRNRQFLAAAPLLRLQIDNCARLHGCSLVASVDEVASVLLAGGRFDKMKATSGEQMTDRFLVEQLAARTGAKWLPRVYERTSGYVHFSGAHLHASSDLDAQTRVFSLSITRREARVPLALWLEMIEAFSAATGLLVGLARSWASQKDLEREAENRGSSE